MWTATVRDPELIKVHWCLKPVIKKAIEGIWSLQTMYNYEFQNKFSSITIQEYELLYTPGPVILTNICWLLLDHPKELLSWWFPHLLILTVFLYYTGSYAFYMLPITDFPALAADTAVCRHPLTYINLTKCRKYNEIFIRSHYCIFMLHTAGYVLLSNGIWSKSLNGRSAINFSSVKLRAKVIKMLI